MNIENTSSPQGSSGSSNSSNAGEPATSCDGSSMGNPESSPKQGRGSPGKDEGVWPCVSLIGNTDVMPGPTRLHPPLSRALPSLALPTANDPRVFPTEGDGQCNVSPSSVMNLPSPLNSSTPQTDENETSFTAKPLLTRTNANYDVFEPHSGTEKADDSSEVAKRDGPRNSVGSADFSPIRRIRVKGNVETV